MISIDFDRALVTISSSDGEILYPLDSNEAFEAVSRAWLRCGWDTKHVYSFTWLGRPIIQLPEDMFRIQEVIYKLRPDVIVETGIAHGGSLIFYAALCHTMGHGRVVGVDIEIRPHNRQAIEAHELYPYITLIEGDSLANGVLAQIGKEIADAAVVLVVLDANHTKEHVLGELHAYSPFVTVGSYIVVADGIMEDLVGAPRSGPDWATNNPKAAAEEFVRENCGFKIESPPFAFNEGTIKHAVTYWPGGYLKRVRADHTS